MIRRDILILSNYQLNTGSVILSHAYLYILTGGRTSRWQSELTIEARTAVRNRQALKFEKQDDGTIRANTHKLFHGTTHTTACGCCVLCRKLDASWKLFRPWNMLVYCHIFNIFEQEFKTRKHIHNPKNIDSVLILKGLHPKFGNPTSHLDPKLQWRIAWWK